MSKRAYAMSLATIVMSIFFTPEIAEIFKVYLVTVVAIVSGFITILFRWTELKHTIVSRLMAEATVEMWKPAFQHELAKLITKILEDEKKLTK